MGSFPEPQSKPTATTCFRWGWGLKECFALASAVKGRFVIVSEAVLAIPCCDTDTNRLKMMLETALGSMLYKSYPSYVRMLCIMRYRGRTLSGAKSFARDDFNHAA